MISVVIPHMPFPEANIALKQCVNSIKEPCEKIVVVNAGIGYAAAVNIGLDLAHGDQIIICNNDTYLIQGSLEQLFMGNSVVVPKIVPEPRDHMPRAFFGITRDIVNRVGHFDERFEGGYFEDDDYIKRMRMANIPLGYNPNVVVGHFNGGGLTMKKIGEQEYFNKNQRVFQSKWGGS